MSDRIPMTPAGKKKVEAELAHFKTEQRPKVIQQLQDARSHGDISENAEFEAAKERQGWVEGRIAELEDKLARAEVINPSSARTDIAVFGCAVTVQDTTTSKTSRYLLVGPEESNAKEGLISVQAPLAKAMLGKKVGEIFEVDAPSGFKEFRIVSIESA
ncbi:MAG: transcription elongation factor GreA [Nitrospirae bacterium]|nr:transcription elongation factor GreA [Nitrospirota bacterium]